MLAMTLLVRDEIDIIARHVQYHLPKVDLLIVTDNGSVDGTREYLGLLPRSERVIVLDEPGNDYRQDLWVDRMIRLAIECGADWVVNSDADEFWMGDLRAAVEKHRGRANALRARSSLMVATDRDPAEADEPDPLLRISHRLVKPRPHEATCIGAWHKLLHATAGWDRIMLGNHDVFFAEGIQKRVLDLPESEVRIRHYTERGWDHYRRKYLQGGEAYTRSPLPPQYGSHWRRRYKVYAEQGGISALRDLYLAESIVRGADVDALCVKDAWPA